MFPTAKQPFITCHATSSFLAACRGDHNAWVAPVNGIFVCKTKGKTGHESVCVDVAYASAISSHRLRFERFRRDEVTLLEHYSLLLSMCRRRTWLRKEHTYL